MHYSKHPLTTPDGTVIIIREDKRGVISYGLSRSSVGSWASAEKHAFYVSTWHSTLDDLLTSNGL